MEEKIIDFYFLHFKILATRFLRKNNFITVTTLLFYRHWKEKMYQEI